MALEGDKNSKMSRRDFLRGLGAAAVGAAVDGALGNKEAQAQMFGDALDKLPAGSIRVTPDQLKGAGLGVETPLVSTILVALSQKGLIPFKFTGTFGDPVYVAEDWQVGKPLDKQIVYLEYKSDPGEYRMTRTRVNLSNLTALYINVNAVSEFLEDFEEQKKKRGK